MQNRWKQRLTILVLSATALLSGCAPQQTAQHKTPSQQPVHEEYAYPGTPPARWEQGAAGHALPYDGTQQGEEAQGPHHGPGLVPKRCAALQGL